MLPDKRNLPRNAVVLMLVLAAISLPLLSASAQILVGDGLHALRSGETIPLFSSGQPLPSLHHATLKTEDEASAPPISTIDAPEIDFWLGRKRVITSGQAGWRYLDTADGPLMAWTKPDFDDSKWKQGAAPLGYGEDSVATEIKFGDLDNNKHPSAFFRLSFSLDQKTKVNNECWAMRALVDDGAVIYLNGQEIQRIRMPEGKIGNLTRPAIKTGSSSGLEGRYVAFDIPPATLAEGKNVLCVSVHQADADSSDLVLDIELLGISARGFALIEEKEKAQVQRVQAAVLIAKAKQAQQAAQGVVIRPAQQTSLVSIFDSRVKPQNSRLKHMLRALPTTIGISENQVAELILATEDTYQRLRTDLANRAKDADQQAHNRLRTEIYQNKISMILDKQLIETFAAILTPAQLQRYSKFVAARKEQRLSTTIEMYYANLNCGLFFSKDQHPKMLQLLREIALAPKTSASYSTTHNPLNDYYIIQRGFTQAASKNDPRIRKILTDHQLKTLKDGVRTGAIYGGGFINVERVLVPGEK